jgi:hypothetical protein
MTKANDKRAKGTKDDSKLTTRGGTLDQPKGARQPASRGGGPDNAKGANGDDKGGGPDKAKDKQYKSKKTTAGGTKRKKTAGTPVER